MVAFMFYYMVCLWVGLCSGNEVRIIVPPEKNRVSYMSVVTAPHYPDIWDEFLFKFSGISSVFCRTRKVFIQIMKANKSQRSCVFVCKRIRMNKRRGSLYCELFVLLWLIHVKFIIQKDFCFFNNALHPAITSVWSSQHIPNLCSKSGNINIIIKLLCWVIIIKKLAILRFFLFF